MHKVNFRQKQEDDLNNFGRVWVEYNNTKPIINIAEPDLIKEIMVKNFDVFTNRQNFGVELPHMSLVDAR